MKYQIAILFTFALFQAPAAQAINPKVFTELAKASEEVSSLRKQAAQATNAAARGQLLLQASERETDAVLMKEFLRADPKMKIHQLAKETLYLHKKVQKGEDLYEHDEKYMPGRRTGESYDIGVWKDTDEMKDWIKDNKKEMVGLAKKNFQPADRTEIAQIRNSFMGYTPGQRAVYHNAIEKRLAKGNDSRVRGDITDRTGGAQMVDHIETILAAGARPTLPRRLDDKAQDKVRKLLSKFMDSGSAYRTMKDLDHSFLSQKRTIRDGQGRTIEHPSRMNIYASIAKNAVKNDRDGIAFAKVIDELEALLTQPNPVADARVLEEVMMKSVRNDH